MTESRPQKQRLGSARVGTYGHGLENKGIAPHKVTEVHHVVPSRIRRTYDLVRTSIVKCDKLANLASRSR